MMAGDALLGAALAFSLCAMALYAVQHGRAGSPHGVLASMAWSASAKTWADACVFFAAMAVIAASALLMWLIFDNRFDVAYVVGYSSAGLPAVYKFSSFWAGQQGSFLLWLLIHSVVGGILIRRKQITASGMGIYMLLEALLAVLVLSKSPFAPQETFVENGMGLNPLLQDPWTGMRPGRSPSSTGTARTRRANRPLTARCTAMSTLPLPSRGFRHPGNDPQARGNRHGRRFCLYL